ncbi:sirohydrochlorin chelatase [Evansella tamaricis]|uniref:Cobalamin biosynthesis protein CbiX n=1 Tax=Evansella tamaricis TaxID=2069301 RepID=A0ABS6JEF5_9BACI|nr:CbiX/SirB N-terminal domain-containing protein [Evansella tamaricis]MBU9711888.1 cobalamin biosynthesis protein CbiX [Evansella tamaricis]
MLNQVGTKLDTKTGVLVVAHGSQNQKWVALIEEAVASLETSAPVTIGYLELIEGKSIADGVRFLENQGVDNIAVIPFFVCSGSTHLNEIQYALGVIEEPAFDTDIELIHPKVPVIWGKAMDAHPLILEVLEARIQPLSEMPFQESLLLVAHGSDRPHFQPVWEETLEDMVEYFKEKFGFSEAGYGTVLPDTITEAAGDLSANGKKKVVAVPVFLSDGYYTSKKIPAKLEGFPHVYNGSAYLPHPSIRLWLQDQVNHYV